MTHKGIINLRLHSLQLAGNLPCSPSEALTHLGALQAQDYEGAKWSMAIRTKQNCPLSIEQAIADRSIVRTWPMRGTLHFVASDDVRWILKLLAPRIIPGMAGRNKQLELDQSIFHKSQDLLLRNMEGTKQLLRSEVYYILEKNGIATSNQRGIHIINYLALNQILCHGSHQEKQPTYALLDDWIPQSKELSTDEALSEIALRYFTGHGPATLQDFIWWTGLKTTDARLALNSISQHLTSEDVEGSTYWFAPDLRDTTTLKSTFLLPGFDEFMLGYTNRTLMVDKMHLPKIIPGNNGMFMPTVVIDGRVEALWKREIKKHTVSIELYPFGKLSINKLKHIDIAAKQYASYLGKELVVKK
jgi:hypothetical protein